MSYRGSRYKLLDIDEQRRIESSRNDRIRPISAEKVREHNRYVAPGDMVFDEETGNYYLIK